MEPNTTEYNMFTAYCPVCGSDDVQPRRNQPGVYLCRHCKAIDILASELVLKPIDQGVPHQDPRNKPSTYGHIN